MGVHKRLHKQHNKERIDTYRLNTAGAALVESKAKSVGWLDTPKLRDESRSPPHVYLTTPRT